MKRNVNLKRMFSLLLIVVLCFSSLGMTMAEGSPPEPSPGAAQAGEVTPTDEAMPTDTPTATPTEEATPHKSGYPNYPSVIILPHIFFYA